MVTAPLMVPFDRGVKVTEMVHLVLPANEAPQAVVPLATALKSALALKLMVTSDVELLIRVTVLDALEVPTVTVPKERPVGEVFKGVTPLPERPRFWTTLGALSVTVSSPKTFPD